MVSATLAEPLLFQMVQVDVVDAVLVLQRIEVVAVHRMVPTSRTEAVQTEAAADGNLATSEPNPSGAVGTARLDATERIREQWT